MTRRHGACVPRLLCSTLQPKRTSRWCHPTTLRTHPGVPNESLLCLPRGKQGATPRDDLVQSVALGLMQPRAICGYETVVKRWNEYSQRECEQALCVSFLFFIYLLLRQHVAVLS